MADELTLDRRLKALAHPSRLALVTYLREPHYLEEIASTLKLSRTAAKEHVDSLLAAGFIRDRKGTRPTGTVVEYELVLAQIFDLLEELREDAQLEARPDASYAPRTTGGADVLPGFDRSGAPELLVVSGLRPGLRRDLARSMSLPAIIGRQPDAQVVLDWDRKVSNRHAQVAQNGGIFEITDLFSTNGTRLNGVLLRGGQPVPLRPGDLIQMGRTLLLFRT
ncbi:MAG: FHA domain-containing protein [Thermoplasmatota archaeon]